MYQKKLWKKEDRVFHEDIGYGNVLEVRSNDLNNQVCYVQWDNTYRTNVLGYELINAQDIPEILRAYDRLLTAALLKDDAPTADIPGHETADRRALFDDE